MHIPLTPAQQVLVTENVRLAYWTANHFRPSHGLDAGELAGAAVLGLISAAAAFDPARGSFPALAGVAIRHAVISKLKGHRRRHLPTVSLDLPTGERCGPLAEFIPAPQPEHPPWLFGDVDRLLATVAPRAAAMVRSYFGLGEPVLTLGQIGRLHGLGRERVRQLIGKALKCMRAHAGAV